MSLFDGPRTPVTPEEYRDWFDSDGRLVKEGIMRQRVFEVGVDPSCRRNLWKFLFGIYPMSSTHREQKTINVENRANYHALRDRWEVLDKTITLPDDDLVQAPPYMELSDGEEEDDSNYCTGKRSSKPSGTMASCVNRRSASDGDSIPNDRSDSGQFDDISLNCDSFSNGETSSSMLNSSSDVEAPSTSCQNHSSDLTTSISSLKIHDNNPSSNGASAGNDSQCSCNFRRTSCDHVMDDDGKALLQILQLPSRVFAMRQPVDLEKVYPRNKRIILRDVLRTDRNYHYFSHNRNLRKVHRILMVYCMFHPDVGYAQGMNDILARFLVVTDSEVDSYWMFSKYMEQKMDDFQEETMMRKVFLVKSLLSEIDEMLFGFFDKSECRDYLFCHRWLLLDFKREFDLEDSIRIFEVLGSHYLELNSTRGQIETDRNITKEFELDGGEMRVEHAFLNPDFTFDLFVCVAILIMHSKDICKAMDAASVYGCLNGLSMNMNLSEVLGQAEYLFYKYCKLTVTRGFSEVTI